MGDRENGLLQLWQDSVTVEKRQDEKGRPIARGVFRVDLGKLLMAVGKTLKAAKETLGGPPGWVLAAAEGLAALAALREAVFDKLNELQYLVLVCVSTSEDGMTPSAAEETVKFFISELEPGILPAYLWIDAEFLTKCQETLGEEDAVHTVLKDLVKKKHLRVQDDRYYQDTRILSFSLGGA